MSARPSPRRIVGIVTVAVLALALLGGVLRSSSAPPLSPTLTPPPIPTNVANAPDALARRGYLMQALSQLEAETARTGWTAQRHRQAGDWWWRMGDLTRALPHWYASQPDDPVLLRRIADAHLTLGQWREARLTLADLLDAQPDDDWAHFQTGLLLASHDPRQAARHLRQVSPDTPYAQEAARLLNVIETQTRANNPLIGLETARQLGLLGYWDRAEWGFRQVAMLWHPLPEALAFVGLARDYQGKDGGPWLEQALTLAPEDARIRYLQGLHLRAIGDEGGSLQAMQTAVALAPLNPGLYAELGRAHQALDQLPEAEYWLTLAVRASNDAPQMQRLLADFYADSALTLPADDVLSALQATTDAAPQDPDVLSAYGWALHRVGQTEAGLQEIDAALERDPRNARARYDKARILLETGELDAARDLLRALVADATPYADIADTMLSQLGG